MHWAWKDRCRRAVSGGQAGFGDGAVRTRRRRRRRSAGGLAGRRAGCSRRGRAPWAPWQSAGRAATGPAAPCWPAPGTSSRPWPSSGRRPCAEPWGSEEGCGWARWRGQAAGGGSVGDEVPEKPASHGSTARAGMKGRGLRALVKAAAAAAAAAAADCQEGGMEKKPHPLLREGMSAPSCTIKPACTYIVSSTTTVVVRAAPAASRRL